MLRKFIFALSAIAVITGFDNADTQNAFAGAAEMAESELVISAYDDIFRAASAEEGCDWLLMSAIAYTESRFEADIVSQRGALGLMQIMPVVGRHFNVPESEIIEPLTNVRLAARLLAEIERMLRIPAGIPERDRMGIVLAGYNSGVGHVRDARRLAREAGENPNSWEVVARYLKLKAEPEYYDKPEVLSGRFTGSRQTLAYVNGVMECYDRYKNMML
ncbi:MAG: transglycosylase SLT domain-containing protein [Alistipes sp.]|nr:transglycosylase SLT domain-containing protein [Alistipes sp.]